MSYSDTGDLHLPARKVWERYGVSDVTLWRWCHDHDMNFPEPLRINRRRYWRLADLEAWERQHTSEAS